LHAQVGQRRKSAPALSLSRVGGFRRGQRGLPAPRASLTHARRRRLEMGQQLVFRQRAPPPPRGSAADRPPLASSAARERAGARTAPPPAASRPPPTGPPPRAGSPRP